MSVYLYLFHGRATPDDVRVAFGDLSTDISERKPPCLLPRDPGSHGSSKHVLGAGEFATADPRRHQFLDIPGQSYHHPPTLLPGG